jgi:hypothetical protein
VARDPHALIAFLEARADWTFGYGPEPRTHDCARFFSAGVAAVTGVAPLDRFAGRWTTELGAARVLRRAGGLDAAVSRIMTEIPITLAQRGDGGLTSGDALVLIEGETVVGLSERGYYRLPRHALLKAWTIA